MRSVVVQSLIVIIFAGFAFTAYADQPNSMDFSKKSSGKSILQVAKNPMVNLKSMSLLDPERFTMKQQTMFSYSSSGSYGSNMMSMYLNTMEYRFNMPLTMRLRVAYQNNLGGLFGNIGNFLGSTGGQQALGGLGGAYLAERAYSRLGDIGEQARREASEIARQGLTQAEFRPFTVTTATGGMMGVGPEGGTTMAVSPQEQALQQQLMGGAGQFFGQAQVPTTAREQAVFERMRAIQQPEEERQRLALEERLAAQGRLGLRTAQYGGAPEQFALAQAQEEARNRAMLTAMQQAQAEQAQQAALGQQFLAAGYVPQAQLIAATQPALTTAQLAQRGQLTGAGLFGEAEMSGLEALLSSGIGQANLMGQIGTGLLSQAFQPVFQQPSTEDQLKSSLFQSLLDKLGLGG